MRCLSQSLQVLGGSGYTQDYPLEQYIRDSKIDTVYEGTTGIQALDLFFRKIARDQGRAIQELLGEIRAFAKGGPDDELTRGSGPDWGACSTTSRHSSERWWTTSWPRWAAIPTASTRWGCTPTPCSAPCPKW